MGQLNKVEARKRRKKGTRSKLRGGSGRPRLTVFRSLRHVYAQVVDDGAGKVLVVASTLDKEVRDTLAERRAEAAQKAAAAKPEESGDGPEQAAAGAAEAAPEPEKKKDKKKGKEKKKKKKKAAAKAVAENAPRRKRLRYRPGTSAGKLLDAVVVGEFIARRCQEAGIEKVVFDRNGFRYHGRVAALADAARGVGLKF